MMNSWFGSGMSDGAWALMGGGLVVVLVLLSAIVFLLIRARPR